MILNKLKHKILAVGSHIMLKRLQHKLDREQFILIGCHNPQEATAILEQDDFDLVIIDNLIHEAEALCLAISHIVCIPVTLLLQEKPANWRNLASAKVDGYLPDSGSSIEFMARLKAYLRPKSQVN